MIKLWQSQFDLDSCLSILENMNLLDNNAEKIVLTPIMIDYINVNIESCSKGKLIATISEYYEKLLTKFYRVNSKLSVNDDVVQQNSQEPFATEDKIQQSPITGQGSDSIESEQSPISVSKMSRNSRFKHLSSFNPNEESQVQTVFEKVLLDIRNIESCLTYFDEQSRQPQDIEETKTLASASPQKDIKKKPLIRKDSNISFNSEANIQKALAQRSFKKKDCNLQALVQQNQDNQSPRLTRDSHSAQLTGVEGGPAQQNQTSETKNSGSPEDSPKSRLSKSKNVTPTVSPKQAQSQKTLNMQTRTMKSLNNGRPLQAIKEELWGNESNASRKMLNSKYSGSGYEQTISDQYSSSSPNNFSANEAEIQRLIKDGKKQSQLAQITKNHNYSLSMNQPTLKERIQQYSSSKQKQRSIEENLSKQESPKEKSDFIMETRSQFGMMIETHSLNMPQGKLELGIEGERRLSYEDEALSSSDSDSASSKSQGQASSVHKLLKLKNLDNSSNSSLNDRSDRGSLSSVSSRSSQTVSNSGKNSQQLAFNKSIRKQQLMKFKSSQNKKHPSNIESLAEQLVGPQSRSNEQHFHKNKTDTKDELAAMTLKSHFQIMKLGKRIIQAKEQKQPQKVRSRRSQQTSQQQSMETSDKFIIMTAANIFLSSDFEYCLKICQYNFSHVAYSAMFEGNLLRFKSLAAEQIFVNSLVENDDSIDEQQADIQMLFYAIEAASRAREVYDTESSGIQNLYGLGLQDFQLGYLYSKHAKYIDSKAARDQVQYEAYLQGDIAMCLQKATHHFSDAYRRFEKLHHLLGKYLCRLHELEITPESSRKAGLQQEVKKLKRQYRDYVREVGLTKTCHIPREQGEVISLLTEIVDGISRKSLFPNSKKYEDPLSELRSSAAVQQDTRLLSLAQSSTDSVHSRHSPGMQNYHKDVKLKQLFFSPDRKQKSGHDHLNYFK